MFLVSTYVGLVRSDENRSKLKKTKENTKIQITIYCNVVYTFDDVAFMIIIINSHCMVAYLFD